MSDTSEQILEAVLRQVRVPCIIDADGLNLLTRHNPDAGTDFLPLPRIGEDCILHGQNCIGNKGDADASAAPVIGKNVDIGVGASVIGDIFIADDVKIGAGAGCDTGA